MGRLHEGVDSNHTTTPPTQISPRLHGQGSHRSNGHMGQEGKVPPTPPHDPICLCQRQNATIFHLLGECDEIDTSRQENTESIIKILAQASLLPGDATRADFDAWQAENPDAREPQYTVRKNEQPTEDTQPDQPPSQQGEQREQAEYTEQEQWQFWHAWCQPKTTAQLFGIYPDTQIGRKQPPGPERQNKTNNTN